MSSTGLPNSTSRPRLPGFARRSTAAKGEHSHASSKPPISRSGSLPTHQPSPLLPTSASLLSSLLPGAAEADLDLDLPPELAAVLGSSQSSSWNLSRERRSSDYSSRNDRNTSGAFGNSHIVEEDVSRNEGDLGSSRKGGSLGRKVGSKVGNSLGNGPGTDQAEGYQAPYALNRGLVSSEDATQNTSDASSSGSPTNSPKGPSFNLNSDNHQPVSNSNLYEQELNREGSGEEDEEDSAEDEEEDRAWMEKLPRNDLEALLIQANQVIRERERDLSMAAFVGQALLKKNLSLRNKHDGILGRLNSQIGPDLEEEDETSSRCSPPTTDMGFSADIDDSSLKTPVQHGGNDDGYFEDSTPTNRERERPLLSSGFPTSQQYSRNDTAFPSSGSVESELPTIGRKEWGLNSLGSPPRSVFGRSQPGSPSVYGGSPVKRRNASGASNHSNRSSVVYKAHVESQLASLQEQNDALLLQMSELEAEAEKNKVQGSKRLRTFHTEIDSLTKELEAASQRNAELEQEKVKKESGTSTRKVWRRKAGRADHSGSDVETQEEDQDEVANATINDRYRHFPKGSLTPALTRSPVKDGISPSISRTSSISGRSDDSLSSSAFEAALNNAPRQTAGERALIAQLLAKVSELEEANSLLTQTQSVFNGKIGNLIQEGAKISDAYDAVMNANELDQNLEDGGDITARTADGISSANASPARRRAPGNRYLIETRRTIRSALKRERRESAAALAVALGASSLPRSETMESFTSNSTSLSFGSASSSGSVRKSARRRASASSLGKPRIRITPSAEDLASRNGAASKETDLTSTGRNKNDSLKPSDALSFRAARPRSKRQDVTAVFSRTLRRVLSNASFNGSVGAASSVGSDKEVRQSSILKRKPRNSYSHDGLTPGSSYASDLNHAHAPLPSFESFETTSSIAGDVDSAALRLKYGYGLEEDEEMRARTLGSELGSVYGEDEELVRDGDDAEVDQDEEEDRSSVTHRQDTIENGDMSLSMSLSELQKHFTPSQEDESPFRTSLALPIQVRRGSTGSLAESASAVSDIGNMAFSVSSRASTIILDPPATRFITAPTVEDGNDFDTSQELGHSDRSRELTLRAGPNSFGRLLRKATGDGEWTAGEDIVPRGALKDGEMTQVDTYDLINKAAHRQPVNWADDDDFGKPITESEAKRLGLMEAGIKTGRGLLGWRSQAKENIPSTNLKKGKGRSPNYSAIEDASQVEEREALSELLRLKRLAALQARAEVEGRFGRGKGNSSRSSSSTGDYSLESEVTARTLAIASSRYRRFTRPDYCEESSTPKNRSLSKASGAAFKSDKTRSQDDGGSTLASHSKFPGSGSLAHRGHERYEEVEAEIEGEDGGSTSESEEFEMVDLDPARRRPGRRGTDYFPVATTARYKPAMVRQRVNVASNEAVMWATTWITFATVMLFAFCVAFR